MQNVINLIKNIGTFLKQNKEKDAYVPHYRLLEISEDKYNFYIVRIQLIGKNVTFYAKPEEILADDTLVDQFSPKDIRTLTYLGYLGINAPKYKILAQRLVEDNKIIFAIQKSGEKDPILKTATEILTDRDIIASMNSEDAKTIGYISASESIYDENKLKQTLSQEAKLQLNHGQE